MHLLKIEDTGKFDIIYNFLQEKRLSLHNWYRRPFFSGIVGLKGIKFVEIDLLS